MTTRAIVLDANILIRAVLGVKVSALIADHAAGVSFLAPDTAFQEVQEHLPAILSARGTAAEDLAAALRALDALASVVTAVPSQSYEPSRVAALARIGRRDPCDWSVLACALQLGCPIWTEDRDFFGVGVSVWTTATVGLYLSGEALYGADRALPIHLPRSLRQSALPMNEAETRRGGRRPGPPRAGRGRRLRAGLPQHQAGSRGGQGLGVAAH